MVNNLIKSMTGFGRSEFVNEERKIVVEIKSVNHRYSDITLKMPRKLYCFEAALKNCLKEYISRGKADVYITYEEYGAKDASLKYNKALAAEYVDGLNRIRTDFGLYEELKPSMIARFPDVLYLEEQSADNEEIYACLENTLKEAGKRFTESRIQEGENLKKDMLEKLSEMTALVDGIEKISPQLIEEYKQKLTDKIAELLGDTQIDESRIAMEVTIYADKICIDEEIVRLKSHIAAVQKALTEGGTVGRKLDFIVQEMNREANTILSKSDSLAVTDTGIELKTNIEKIREQIQNIE